MTDPRAALLPPPPAQEARGERVRVMLDGEQVVVSRDYLSIRRRSLIAELNAINEALGIRRDGPETRRAIPQQGPDEVVCRTPGGSGCKR